MLDSRGNPIGPSGNFHVSYQFPTDKYTITLYTSLGAISFMHKTHEFTWFSLTFHYKPCVLCNGESKPGFIWDPHCSILNGPCFQWAFPHSEKDKENFKPVQKALDAFGDDLWEKGQFITHFPRLFKHLESLVEVQHDKIPVHPIPNL